ncbi:MAG: pyridine nucleotide-disulfide oxidoreductase [Erysipelotrichia bacterium]|nr:pyridine nucleotide-disulfide oxidoreductase [Erysipelotrichia bacterium]NCC54513.1 pyridine nucleotide-disulfide oxidoreductase [Erysipelotrichia bacterium]
MKKYDAILIGFGKGAKTLAAQLAKANKKVALIEKSKEMYGGTCINEGCIPTKTLIKQASAKSYEEAMRYKETLIQSLRQKNYDKLASLENVTIYTAEAHFKSDYEVVINIEGKEEVLQAEYIFINTGSTSIIPNIEGIQETKHIYTSATLMKETKLPNSLAIIGGGYIGLEFASMFASYGSKVSVFEHGDRLIKREDEEVVDAILETLNAQGVNFIFHSSVHKVQNQEEQVLITYSENNEEKTAVYDAVLVATGRKANIDALKLENTGIKVDERGNIIVSETLETSVKNVYAMGDVKGGLQFTYISLDDYRIVASQILQDQSRTTNNRGAIPYSMFTTPTFSRVGLSEQEAIAQGYEVKTATLLAAAIPRAHVVNQSKGILKAVVDAKSDHILGCVLFCTDSEEMINIVALAMNHGIKAHDLANHIFTHPTMSEALNDLFSSLK